MQGGGLVGEGGCKQQLETAGRGRQLLVGAAQLSGCQHQGFGPSGLILALRIAQKISNRTPLGPSGPTLLLKQGHLEQVAQELLAMLLS